MAKKTTTKKTKNDNTEIENVSVSVNINKDIEIKKDEMSSNDVNASWSEENSPKYMGHLSPQELQSYEASLRMLILYYEKMLRLDEIEGRPVMSDNRNMFTRLTLLHNKLIKFIENKILNLENYVWE